jgi:hypothetical protein
MDPRAQMQGFEKPRDETQVKNLLLAVDYLLSVVRVPFLQIANKKK